MLRCVCSECVTRDRTDSPCSECVTSLVPRCDCSECVTRDRIDSNCAIAETNVRTLPPTDSTSLAPVPPRSRCANNVTLGLQLGSVCAPGARRQAPLPRGLGRGLRGARAYQRACDMGGPVRYTHKTSRPCATPRQRQTAPLPRGLGQGARGARADQHTCDMGGTMRCTHKNSRPPARRGSGRPPHGCTREPRPHRHTWHTATRRRRQRA